MLLLNFSHPFTTDHVDQIEQLLGEPVSAIRDIPTQFDPNQPFAEQVRELVDSVGLSSLEWQTLPILFNPPSYNFAALTLLAELHGRMGYFPAIIRTRPVENSNPPRYEVAEIINLQSIRDLSRITRASDG